MGEFESVKLLRKKVITAKSPKWMRWFGFSIWHNVRHQQQSPNPNATSNGIGMFNSIYSLTSVALRLLYWLCCQSNCTSANVCKIKLRKNKLTSYKQQIMSYGKRFQISCRTNCATFWLGAFDFPMKIIAKCSGYLESESVYACVSLNKQWWTTILQKNLHFYTKILVSDKYYEENIRKGNFHCLLSKKKNKH